METLQIIGWRILGDISRHLAVRRAVHAVEPADQERYRSTAMRQDQFEIRKPVHHAGGNQRSHRQSSVVGVGDDLVQGEFAGTRRCDRLRRVNEHRRVQLDAGGPVFVEIAFAKIPAIDMRGDDGAHRAVFHAAFQFACRDGRILQCPGCQP